MSESVGGEERLRGRLHTEAEDHDIASNDDGLAIMRKSAPMPARGQIPKRHVAPGPGTSSSIEYRR